MPLRGESTQWLWEKPLPCYDPSHLAAPEHDNATSSRSPTVLGIISDEFYKWPDLRNRTRAALSPDPVDTIAQFEKLKQQTEEVEKNQATDQKTKDGKVQDNPKQDMKQQPDNGIHRTDSLTSEPELTSTISTIPQDLQNTSSFNPSWSPSPSPSPSPLPASTANQSSKTSISSATAPSSSPPKALLYRITQSAHLSQSDFGVLFPNLTRWLMKSISPQELIQINVRAVLGLMAANGLNVQRPSDDQQEEQKGSQQSVLLGMHGEKRLVKLELEPTVEEEHKATSRL